MADVQLVTGADGFVGRRLVHALRERGLVVCAHDVSDGDIAGADLDLPPVRHVFHLAAKTFVVESWADPRPFYHTNLMGTLSVLELCRRNQASLTMVSWRETDLHHLASPISGNAHHPIKLERSADRLQLVLDEELSNLLEYWEVDPNYDGQLFRSAVQVTRQRNKKIIQNIAELPDVPGSRPVCVRWVDLKGEQAHYLLVKPASDLPAASG